MLSQARRCEYSNIASAHALAAAQQSRRLISSHPPQWSTPHHGMFRYRTAQLHSLEWQSRGEGWPTHESPPRVQVDGESNLASEGPQSADTARIFRPSALRTSATHRGLDKMSGGGLQTPTLLQTLRIDTLPLLRLCKHVRRLFFFCPVSLKSKGRNASRDRSRRKRVSTAAPRLVHALSRRPKVNPAYLVTQDERARWDDEARENDAEEHDDLDDEQKHVLGYMSGGTVLRLSRSLSRGEEPPLTENTPGSTGEQRILRALVSYGPQNPPLLHDRVIKEREKKALVRVTQKAFARFLVPLATTALDYIAPGEKYVVANQRGGLVRLLLSKRLRALVAEAIGSGDWTMEEEDHVFARLVQSMHTNLCSDVRWLLNRTLSTAKKRSKVAKHADTSLKSHLQTLSVGSKRGRERTEDDECAADTGEGAGGDSSREDSGGPAGGEGAGEPSAKRQTLTDAQQAVMEWPAM
eukprot:TRINITY_DN335_c0_g1_i5.p1 TRINITY_DN335_c0_g1~~TRINITY_DN335_c0_g1_i5.p1  ORF type:complete len:467 (-),score=21.82 TRINITY_DN335_c0_g1_i5:100-1500(-)